MRTIFEFAEELQDEVLSGTSQSNIIDMLEKWIKEQELEPKYCMPDGIKSQEEHEEYLKAIGYSK